MVSNPPKVTHTMNNPIIHHRIVINPQVRSGKPCIKNTRITVQDILEYLGGGSSFEEVLNAFPDLQREDITACLAFAAQREQYISVIHHEAVA